MNAESSPPGSGASGGGSSDRAWVDQLLRVFYGTAAARRDAARRLAELGDPRALAFLLGALSDDDDPTVRTHAAEALGWFDDPAVRQALQAALSDRDPAVRAAVQAALER